MESGAAENCTDQPVLCSFISCLFPPPHPSPYLRLPHPPVDPIHYPSMCPCEPWVLSLKTSKDLVLLTRQNSASTASWSTPGSLVLRSTPCSRFLSHWSQLPPSPASPPPPQLQGPCSGGVALLMGRQDSSLGLRVGRNKGVILGCARRDLGGLSGRASCSFER